MCVTLRSITFVLVGCSQISAANLSVNSLSSLQPCKKYGDGGTEASRRRWMDQLRVIFTKKTSVNFWVTDSSKYFRGLVHMMERLNDTSRDVRTWSPPIKTLQALRSMNSNILHVNDYIFFLLLQDSSTSWQYLPLNATLKQKTINNRLSSKWKRHLLGSYSEIYSVTPTLANPQTERLPGAAQARTGTGVNIKSSEFQQFRITVICCQESQDRMHCLFFHPIFFLWSIWPIRVAGLGLSGGRKKNSSSRYWQDRRLPLNSDCLRIVTTASALASTGRICRSAKAP